MILSIIVPAYNVEKYLKKCIESLVTQESIDYEIIIVNDGSKDSTLDIARSLEEHYSCVKVIDQENKGLGGARNTGIINAKGKYITFVDSDDFLVNNTYGALFKEILKDEYDVACFKFVKFYEAKKIEVNNDLNIKGEVMLNDQAMKEFYKNEITSYAWDKIYNINLFRENNILYPEGTLYEDLRTTYELLRNSKKVIKFNFLGYMYLQRPESISKNIKKKNLDDFICEYLKVINSIGDNRLGLKEVRIYKTLKYNALIRMKMKGNLEDYKIDDRIKIKLSKIELLFNKNLGMNEKVINFIGDNKFIFNLLRKVKKSI